MEVDSVHVRYAFAGRVSSKHFLIEVKRIQLARKVVVAYVYGLCGHHMSFFKVRVRLKSSSGIQLHLTK